MAVVSVAEIARRAGVSVATVSRVLNNNPHVRPETVEQVRRVLAEVGYVRPLIRRGPRLGRRGKQENGRIIVLSVGDPTRSRFNLPVFAGVLNGIMLGAREQRLSLDVVHVEEPDPNLSALNDTDVKGALLFGLPAEPQFAEFLAGIGNRLPIVRVMGDSDALGGVDHIAPDNFAVGYLAASHLMETQPGPLAFATATPPRELLRSRAAGFLSAACKASQKPTCYVIHSDARNAQFYGAQVVQSDSPQQLVERLLSDTPRATGVFFGRDYDAQVLQPLLQAQGVQIGKEMSVISCDNDGNRLGCLDPKPATIDLCTEEIGRRALARLCMRIENPSEPPIRILVSPRIAPR